MERITQVSRFLTLLMLLPLVLLPLAMVSCGDSNDDDEYHRPLLLRVLPDGGWVTRGAVIQLTFDKDPGNLTAVGGTVFNDGGKIRSVSVNAETVILSWDNGGGFTLYFRFFDF